MKNPLTPIQKINKLKSQIKVLNSRLIEGKVRNVYAIKNKIETLKNDLKVEMENHYWENYLSI
jgi:Txe/YoeB family toxin of Txe-Axe toxin-antitoxin module